MPTKQTLITSCQKGNIQSQYLLVKQYTPMLLTVCRRYARDESMAKDALQETFILIFKNIEKYEFNGSFEAWIRKIAINVSLKRYERKYYQNELSTYSFEDRNWKEPKVFKQLEAEEVIKQIQTLPDGYRTVLNLYVFEGLSHKEIAEILKISIGTSRSQLLRARKMLKEKLIDFPKIESA